MGIHDTERYRQGYGQARGAYFNDLRNDRRYRSDRDDDDDEREGHGMLYNLGHRIGEALGEWFGPSSPERRAGPRGYQRPDDRIRDEICERLTFANGVDVGDVSVDVEQGVVRLAGTVSHRNQKYDIEDIADNTFGVTEVDNKIRVERQSAYDTTSAGFNGW